MNELITNYLTHRYEIEKYYVTFLYPFLQQQGDGLNSCVPFNHRVQQEIYEEETQ